MEETYTTPAIILNRRAFNEDDNRIMVYTKDRGKLELVARGTKKIKSKLAGHLEPLCLSDIMVVRGRQYDYIGSAVSETCHGNIKSDLNKLTAAGEALNIFNKLVKIEQADQGLFVLLSDFLEILDSHGLWVMSHGLWSNIFILKLMVELGYKPELHYCVGCNKKIGPGGNMFGLGMGGIICRKCSTNLRNKNSLIISDNCIKILRIISENNLDKLIKLKLSTGLSGELIKIIYNFQQHHAV